MAGFRIDTTGFEQATRAIAQGVKKNMLLYGKSIARQFAEDARREAPFQNQRGVARAGFAGEASATGAGIAIRMSATAPNYKRGPHSAEDYMEYLEFDHEKAYATVFPVANSMRDGIAERFGEAVLLGKCRVRIRRNREMARRRAFRYRHGLMRTRHAVRGADGRFKK